MNLYELIQQIPYFIADTLRDLHNHKDLNLNLIGEFHIGYKYDINIWFSN